MVTRRWWGVSASSIARRTAEARSAASAWLAGDGPRSVELGDLHVVLELDLAVLPGVAAHFRGGLEDGELVGPGGESAPPLERVEAGQH